MMMKGKKKGRRKEKKMGKKSQIASEDLNSPRVILNIPILLVFKL